MQNKVQEAIDLVHREAALLDERRFEDWLGLYSQDAWYWMPASPGQSSPEEALSLIFEDRRLLALRVRRLENPNIHIETPPTRAHRHVSGVHVSIGLDAGLSVSSSQLIVMLREGEQRLFSARCEHHLIEDNGRLLIASKTVRLLDCDAAQRGFAVPL